MNLRATEVWILKLVEYSRVSPQCVLRLCQVEEGCCSSSFQYPHLHSRRCFYCQVTKKGCWQQRVWSDWQPLCCQGLYLVTYYIGVWSKHSVPTHRRLQELVVAWWLLLSNQSIGIVLARDPGFNPQWLLTFQLTPFNKHTLFFPFIGRWVGIWTRQHWCAMQNTVLVKFHIYIHTVFFQGPTPPSK